MMARRRRSHWLLPGAIWTYQRLLLLYPRTFRREYGLDMTQLFGDLCRDALRWRGRRGLLHVIALTLDDLVRSAPREHLAQLRRPGRHRRQRHAPGTRLPADRSRLGPSWRGRLLARAVRRVPHPTALTTGTGSRRDRSCFIHFSDKAQRVLASAHEEARRLNQHAIGPEHLLMGLASEPKCTANKVLRRLDVDPRELRIAVEYLVRQRGSENAAVDGLTPQAKLVIELTVDESRRTCSGYVGTEHLLLALLRERDGIVASVMDTHGLRLDGVLQATCDVLRKRGGRPG